MIILSYNINFFKNVDDIKIDSEISNKVNLNDIKLVEYQVDDKEVDKNLITFQDDGEKFNQFEVNKEKFNVDSSYCESKYTTVLNYDNIPEHLKEKAQRVESELLNQGVNNTNNANIIRHIKEERGLVEGKDYEDENEEFKYSSVYRNENPVLAEKSNNLNK